MFAPTNYLPFAQTFQRDTIGRSRRVSTDFNHNLADVQFRASGSGRDSYIYADNGGFSNIVTAFGHKSSVSKSRSPPP